jgi:hypothetical protein
MVPSASGIRSTSDLLDLEEFLADPEFALPQISPGGRRLACLASADATSRHRHRSRTMTIDRPPRKRRPQ